MFERYAEMLIILCKDNANREQKHQACLNVMPRCSLLLCKDNANREQNRQTTFECYAEMQLILCKDNANHWFNKINAMFFENMSKVNIRSHASHLYATDKIFAE